MYLPAGTNTLPTLDSFTISHVDHRPKPKQRMLLSDYLLGLDRWPHINQDDANNKVSIGANEPKDVDCYWPANPDAPQYEIIWLGA